MANQRGLIDTLTNALGSGGLDRISRQIGADREQTERAVAAALPVLLGGLAREAEGQGAGSLNMALAEDHDGSVLDDFATSLNARPAPLAGGPGAGGGIFGDRAPSRATNGDGILRHVLGAKRTPVEQGIGRASGLGGAQVASLLATLAPMLMGVLGRFKRQQGMGQNEVADLLRGESETIEQQAPPGRFGRLREILDADQDGDISDEVVKIGAALGGAFLLGKLRRT